MGTLIAPLAAIARAASRSSRVAATVETRVVSDKMNKTIVVEVERRVQHAEYTRTIKRTSRFHAHDEANAAKVGDRVRIEETRPMSKLKRWRLREIVTKAQA